MNRVHILLTCRRPELYEASTLVFKTLRVGFPTAQVTVWQNRCCGNCPLEDAGIEYRETDTIHHEWIEALLETEQAPFWILDTDVHFWETVEGWQFTEPLAGRLIPQFWDEYANCVDQPRLHTALMWLDPVALRSKVTAYRAQFAAEGFNPGASLIDPTYLPIRRGRNLFFDTLCLMYHAIGGQAFTNRQLDAFEHMNFGTIADLVLPRLKEGAEMAKARTEFLAHPERFRGSWRAQNDYYARHSA